jgi:hypothetical protein
LELEVSPDKEPSEEAVLGILKETLHLIDVRVGVEAQQESFDPPAKMARREKQVLNFFSLLTVEMFPLFRIHHLVVLGLEKYPGKEEE